MHLNAFSIFMGVSALMILAGCAWNVVSGRASLRDGLLIAAPGVGTAILLIFAYELHSGYLIGIAILLLLFVWGRAAKMIQGRLEKFRGLTP